MLRYFITTEGSSIFSTLFHRGNQAQKPHRKFCIYTEAEGYLLQDILGIEPEREFLSVLYLGDDERSAKSLHEEFRRLGYDFSVERILEAMSYAKRSLRLSKKQFIDTATNS